MPLADCLAGGHGETPPSGKALGRDLVRHRMLGRLLARTVVSGAMIVSLSAVAMGASVAYAAGTTRYVGMSAGGDTSCADPGYTSAQSAVDAASPGDTVYLCGTTPFTEQVIINK